MNCLSLSHAHLFSIFSPLETDIQARRMTAERYIRKGQKDPLPIWHQKGPRWRSRQHVRLIIWRLWFPSYAHMHVCFLSSHLWKPIFKQEEWLQKGTLEKVRKIPSQSDIRKMWGASGWRRLTIGQIVQVKYTGPFTGPGRRSAKKM